MIEIIETEEKFKALESIWRKLEQGAKMRVFQTFDWCWNAWKYYHVCEEDVKLWIVHWSQGEEHVIFPFYIDASKTLRFIMDTHSDTLDVIYQTGKNHHLAFKDCVESILEEKRIKSVLLQKTFGESESLRFFSVLLPGPCVCRDHAFSWVDVGSNLPFLANQNHLRSKDKVRYRGILKKANECELCILSAANGDAFPKDTILRIRNAMIGSSRADTSFLTNDMIDFIAKIYEKGLCEIPSLSVQGLIEALDFRLVKDGRSLAWIFITTNPHRATELYIRYAETSKRYDQQVLDFGVGPYGWKLLTFRPEVSPTFSIRLGKTVFRHALCLASANIRMAKDYIKFHFKVGHR